MSRIIYEFESGDGIARVEAEAATGPGPVAVGRGGEIVEQAAKGFEEALSGIRPIAEGVVKETALLPSAPSKVEATFGIKLSGELGAILARTKAEAHVEIKLTWSPLEKS